MDNKFISKDSLRKCKARENETPSQCEACLAKQCKPNGKREQERIVKNERHVLHVTKNKNM